LRVTTAPGGLVYDAVEHDSPGRGGSIVSVGLQAAEPYFGVVHESNMRTPAEGHLRMDGSPMSRVEVRDNLMSMILAGHETTTGELAWACQQLAHNP
jgi:hypothetical protein